jgi:hypothetical protein
MLDQRDLLTIAQGAAGAAQAYILECLSVEPPAEGTIKMPLSDEQMQSMLMALTFTVVLLETTIKVNVRNPELRAQIRAMLEGVADKIANKAIDKLGKSDIVSP